MGGSTVFSEIIIVLLAGLIGGYFAAKLKLPTILGYILAGVTIALVFPLIGLDKNINSNFVKNIAEFGVALLLFASGIEFSMSNISKIKKLILTGVIGQTFIVIVASLLILPILGFSSFESLFIGSVVAMSSTAFTLKMLELKRELSSHHGKIMIGWLVMQDIFIIAIFLMLDTLSPTSNASASDLLLAVAKSIFVIVVSLGLGKYVIPTLVTKISNTTSRELLLIAAVTLSIGFALFAESLGVSYTLGSFLTGLALSETFLKHEIFAEIKPMRDLFTMFFFVTIGTLFNIKEVSGNIVPLIVILFVIVLIKIITILAINTIFKVHTITGLKVALGISQIGEFAFVGITLGLNKGWIDSKIYSLVLIATIVTMSATPYLYGKADKIYQLLEKNLKKYSLNIYKRLFIDLRLTNESSGEKGLNKHVIVCGFGKVGKYVCKSLELNDKKFIVIEVDPTLIKEAEEAGYKAIFGDATNKDILEKADTSKATALVITLPPSSQPAAQTLIHTAKELNPDIKILLRTRGDIKEYKDLDTYVHDFIEPEFEAAVRITSKLGKIFELNQTTLTHQVRQIREKELKEILT